ncbi:WxL protein peptidoglycan domain-containing protein [uncultured Microbacterium sp.]|uniref:WxL protein peptidoglycan domain-containing protein n=1 Tax=uncultured Microbacterium sp. TaxID=191216 RepID=UPI0035CC8563
MPFSTTRSGRRTLVTLGALVLTFAALSTFIAPSGSASAADDPGTDPSTVGVATRPASADGQPDSRTRFTYSADPGQTISDQVLVGNTGTQREDFTVYATDAYNGGDGSFALLATADTPTQIGAWVSFADGSSRLQFSLEPNEARLVPFTVTLPADATPGDHAGGLVASVLQEGQQVSVDRRVATPIFTRVSGDLQPQLTITSIDAAYQGDWWNPFNGSVKILYTVDNGGNVALAANLDATTVTWFGIPATGTQGASIPVLLPGSTATYEATLSGVGQWGYLNPAIRMQPFVDSPDPAQQLTVTPVSRDTILVAIPWLLLILIALIVAIILFVRWRRKRDEARAQEWIEYTEQQAMAAAAAALPVGAGAGRSADS